MISKPVPANSFYHTCRYITNKPGAEVLITEGVRGHDYKLMAADFELQQQLRPSKTKACFHSILSFYPGEKPSDALMKEIAKRYLKELGITNTQYAVSKHTDKAHLHMHIVANMVNNQGRAISDSWIGLRGKKIAQRLTQEYKLIPALRKNLQLTNLEALSQSEANKYKIYIAISEDLPHCKTLQELEQRLLNLGIETQYKYKGQTQEKQGISFKLENICFKGSQVDRKFSFAGLEKTLELNQKQELQKQTRKQTPFIATNYSGYNKVTQQPSPDIIEKEIDLGHELAKGLEKTLDILLKPQYDESQSALTEFEKEQLRKKKKRHQIRR